jgi:protoheme IX farnesyltransferase
MIHRGFGCVAALVVVIAAIQVGRRARGWPALRALAIAAPVVAAAQVTLGVYTVLTMRSVPIAVAHFAGAASLFAIWLGAWLVTGSGRRALRGVGGPGGDGPVNRTAADLIALVKPNIAVMALLTAAGGMSLAPGPFVLDPRAGGAARHRAHRRRRQHAQHVPRARGRSADGADQGPAAAGRADGARAGAGLRAGPGRPRGADPVVRARPGGAVDRAPRGDRLRQLRPGLHADEAALAPGAVGRRGAGRDARAHGLDLGDRAPRPRRARGVRGLFFWQIPHFDAIALYRQKDYDRAGLVTVPGARGPAAARVEIVMYSLVQLAASLLLFALGVCGRGYLVVATAAGLGFAALAARGLWRGDARWARSVFLASIVYLPTVYAAMVVDGRL